MRGRRRPAQSLGADHERRKVLQATQLGVRQGQEGREMKDEKVEIRNPKSENAATDETRIKHGNPSVLDTCFIRGYLPFRISAAFSVTFCCVFLLNLSSGCQKAGSARIATNLPPTITTKGGLEMVQIPAGSFQMGSRTGKEDEAFLHTVTLDAFLIDRRVEGGLYFKTGLGCGRRD